MHVQSNRYQQMPKGEGNTARRRKAPRASQDDPEQFQRFLEKARELGIDPTSEVDLHRFDGVLRRVARLPTQRELAERRGPDLTWGAPMGGSSPKGKARGECASVLPERYPRRERDACPPV